MLKQLLLVFVKFKKYCQHQSQTVQILFPRHLNCDAGRIAIALYDTH